MRLGCFVLPASALTASGSADHSARQLQSLKRGEAHVGSTCGNVSVPVWRDRDEDAGPCVPGRRRCGAKTSSSSSASTRASECQSVAAEEEAFDSAVVATLAAAAGAAAAVLQPCAAARPLPQRLTTGAGSAAALEPLAVPARPRLRLCRAARRLTLRWCCRRRQR